MADPKRFQPGAAPAVEKLEQGDQGDPSLEEFKGSLEKLSGPIDNFKLDLVVCFQSGSEDSRAKLNELVTTYAENVGAFFGKLFGDDSFADIKMVLTSRDAWNKSTASLGKEDIAFILGKVAEEPKLRELLPEGVAAVLDAGVDADAASLRKLLNAFSNPDRPDDIVLLQRAFNEGVDPLAVIGGLRKEEIAQAYPEVAPLLLEETRRAHHKGAMGIGYEAARLLDAGKGYDEMTPQEQAAVLWTTTAFVTELYGDEVTTSPQEKWDGQVQPVAEMMTSLIGAESNETVDERLSRLANEGDLSFHEIKTAAAAMLQEGATSLSSDSLFELAVASQRAKIGEVSTDADNPFHDLFYADTAEYPYLTMAFMGEQIGIQKVTEDATRMSEHGEVSMSLPPSIVAELHDRFPFLDKHQQIALRPDGEDYEVPISGPSASYVYINDGTFFNDPDRVYRYSVGEEEREVRPSELLDFLRSKRQDLVEA